MQDTSKQMKSVWANYTVEERQARIKKVSDSANSSENNIKRAAKLRGIKRPPRTKEHILKIKRSNSIGDWCFGNFKELSSNDLAKKLGVSQSNIKNWCDLRNDTKITRRSIINNPQIFKEEDLGKTFKEKGFTLKKRP